MKLMINDPLYHCVVSESFEVNHYENGSTYAKVIYPSTFYPQKDKTYPDKFPIVFFVQGSGWQKQNLNLEVAQLSSIARRGYCVVILGYRDLSYGPYPLQVNDVMDSMHYFLTRNTNFPLDKQTYIISGDSSGGHTALMAACMLYSKYKDLDQSCLKAVIDFYGACDLSTLLTDTGYKPGDDISDTLEGQLLRLTTFDPQDDIFNESSVYTALSETTLRFPLLIIHGEDDPIVPFSQSKRLYELALNLNFNVTFLELSNAVHGGDIIFSEQILYKVTQYIAYHINPVKDEYSY